MISHALAASHMSYTRECLDHTSLPMEEGLEVNCTALSSMRLLSYRLLRKKMDISLGHPTFSIRHSKGYIPEVSCIAGCNLRSKPCAHPWSTGTGL